MDGQCRPAQRPVGAYESRVRPINPGLTVSRITAALLGRVRQQAECDGVEHVDEDGSGSARRSFLRTRAMLLRSAYNSLV